LYVSEQLLYW